MADQSNSAAQSRGILVLGMHRSGTSAITRGLSALGVDLGANFLETRFDNPTGYWEDKGVVELQDRLLALFGMTWEGSDLIDEARWSSPAVSPFVAEARHYLVNNLARRPLWAFKDPRTLRLLPLWLRVMLPLDIDDSYLVIVRNPLSVAASLHQRQGMEAAVAHRLWLAYVVPYLGLVIDRRLVVVDYDLFMDDSSRELDRISTALGLAPSSATLEARAEYLQNFLQAERRHALFYKEELWNSANVPDLNRDAYRWLRRLATDELTPTSATFQKAWLDLETTAKAELAAK